MAINDMDVIQSSTILEAAIAQAQGDTSLAKLSTSGFTTLANIALKTGLDKLSTGLSQVLSKTIFAVRPYNRKFQILENDAIRYGNHVRKINYIDEALEDTPAYSLTDTYSVDQQVVKKPQALQMNYYGYNTFNYHQTVYRQQLEMALRGPEEWTAWLSGLMQHVQNKMEKAHEESARMTIANLIGAQYYMRANTSCVVHLLTEYNTWSGESLTASTVFNPENFKSFAQWFYGKLATMSRLLTERSSLYHLNVASKTIERHTPVEDQRLILLAPNMDQIASNVLANVFNDGYLRTIPREEINYWQNIADPATVKINAGYVKADGTTGSADVTLSSIVFGVLFDRDAAGYTTVDTEYGVAPYNVPGKYWNHFWSFQDRYYNDVTENCVIFLLD